MFAGSLKFDTKLDADGFQKGINKMTGSAKSGGSTIKNIVAGLGITKLVEKSISMITDSIDGAVSRIDTLNNFPKVMSNLGISAKDSAKVINDLSDKLTGLPTSLDEAALSVQRLTSKNGDVKKSEELFLALNNAILAGGASTEIQATAMEQISQAYAKGKPDMMEWRALQTAMPAQLKQVSTAMLSNKEALNKYIKAAQEYSKANPMSSIADELLEQLMAVKKGTGDMTTAVGTGLRAGVISMDDFMNQIVTMNKKGVNGFKSLEEQARNSTGGIKTNITNMKTAITRGTASMMTSLDKGLKKAKLGGIAEQINSFGKNSEKVLKSIGKKIEKINWQKTISASKTLAAAISLVIARMLVYKTLTTAVNTFNMAKRIISDTMAFISLAKEVGSVTKAMGVLNVVMNANPIGLIATGIVALGAGIFALTKYIKKATENTNEHYIAAKRLASQQNELTNSINESAKARANSISDAEAEAGAIDVLFNRLVDLESVENKSNAQKQAMKQLVSELNDLVPELNLKYNEEKDALNQSINAIRNKIKAQKELIKAEAAQSQLKEIAKEQVKAQTMRMKLETEQAKNKRELAKAEKELAEASKKANSWGYKSDEDIKRYDAAQKKVKELKEAVDKNNTSLKKNKEILNQLNKEYSNTEKYASNAFNNQQIQKQLSGFNSIAKKYGKSIPKSVSKGMGEGSYAVPKSVNELKKLIKFDEAIDAANLSGKKIPSYISKGVISGKYSVEQAMKKVKTTISLADDVKKQIKEGKSIPNNLAEGILDGSISVAKAKKILQNSIEFDNLKSKVKKAGYDIPKELANGITTGEITPKTAIDRVQALLTFDTAVQNAGVKGLEIPTNLSEGILSGELSVTEASKIMNSWIVFNQANKDALETGTKIPKYISDGILSGKTSVETANTQMNQWIEFNRTVNAAKKAGVDVSKSLADNVSSGKTNVTTATNNLKAGIQKSLSGTKSIGVDAGGNLIEGTKQGVDNKKKQNSVFASIARFGTSLLHTLKLSLDEHSPSKTTKKYGVYLLEGLGLGISKKQKALYNQVDKLGKTTLKRLYQSLNKKSSLNDVQKISFWSSIVSHTKKGTTAYNQAVKKLNTSKSNIKKNVATATETFATDMKKIDEEIKQIKESIMNSMNLFDRFKASKSKSKETLKENLFSQVEALKEWDKTLIKLKKKIKNKNLYEFLENQGVTSLKTLQEIDSMSTKELRDYEALYTKKEQIATKRANSEYAEKIESAKKTYINSLKKLGVDGSKASRNVGKQIAAGINSGFTSGMKETTTSLKKQLKKMLNSVKKQLKIHSPSRVYRDDVGKQIAVGIGVGIELNASSALKAIRSMNDEMYREMKKSIVASTNSVKADAFINSNYGINNTININNKFEGNVDLDGKKVGRVITPHVVKTLKNGGAI